MISDSLFVFFPRPDHVLFCFFVCLPTLNFNFVVSSSKHVKQLLQLTRTIVRFARMQNRMQDAMALVGESAPA